MSKMSIHEELEFLLDIYVNEQGNCTGGLLHVVLDEENIDNRFVKFCFRETLINNELVGHRIAKIIYYQSESERLQTCKLFKIIAKYPVDEEDNSE